jgi:hypothetical protein
VSRRDQNLPDLKRSPFIFLFGAEAFKQDPSFDTRVSKSFVSPGVGFGKRCEADLSFLIRTSLSELPAIAIARKMIDRTLCFLPCGAEPEGSVGLEGV